MKIIGLTGGIASGKTTVSNILREKGFVVIDSDEISRGLLEVGTECFNDVVNKFGNRILRDNGTINRKELGNIIFKEETKRELLNSIIHPNVFKLIDIALKKHVSSEFVFVDMPLLFEVHYESKCDAVVCVYTSKNIQLQRLINRDDITETDAKYRINAQIDIEIKKKKSDYVIDNNEGFTELYSNVEKVLDLIKNEI